MAAEYKRQTGNKLPFGSGSRSQDENSQVGGAATSLHLSGQAADLTSASVAELKQRGLLDKYGFKQNPRSAWHISDTGYMSGGIATGPKSGYQATLHGTEAVVPLPNGQTIPVEMSGMSNNMQQQLNLMVQQVGKLDELVSVMRNQVSVSNKILQVSQA
jgi:hypothetical protein